MSAHTRRFVLGQVVRNRGEFKVLLRLSGSPHPAAHLAHLTIMSLTSGTPDDVVIDMCDRVVERARGMRELVRSEAAESERLRTLTPAIVDEMWGLL